MTKVVEHGGKRYVEVKRRASVGDVVKVVANTHSDQHRFSIGTIGTCRLIVGARVSVGDDKTSWLLADADYVVLEPVKFVAGDKVRVKALKSIYGKSIDTSVPHTYGDISSTGVGRVYIDGGSFVVRQDDIEPWVDAVARAGDWVRSTTGRSQTGFSVPTNVDYEVYKVFENGNVNVRSDGPWGTLVAGTYRVVKTKAQADAEKIVAERKPTPPIDLSKYREVKRVAKVGEKILVVNANITQGKYNDGDVRTVRDAGPYTVAVEEHGWRIHHEEYVVLEPLSTTQREIRRPAKVGETVKIVGNTKIRHRFEIRTLGVVAYVANDLARVKRSDGLMQYVSHADYVVIANSSSVVDTLSSAKAAYADASDAHKASYDIYVDTIKAFDTATKALRDAEKAAYTPGAIVRLNDGKLAVVAGSAYGGKYRCRTWGDQYGWENVVDVHSSDVVYAADHPIAKSLAARKGTTFRSGDVVDLTDAHPRACRGKRRTLGSPWGTGWGFNLVPDEGVVGLNTTKMIPDATLVTPVELRTDISDDEKLRLVGATN